VQEGSLEVTASANEIAPKAAIAAVVERNWKIAGMQGAGSNAFAQILKYDARDVG
jgi:hypothetical protein